MLNDINTITIILAVALGIFLLLLIILAAVYFSSKSKEKKEEQAKTPSTNTNVKKDSKKTYTVESVFDFMDFDKIEDNMISQKNGERYIMVVECQGVNYDLMSEVEKNAVEEGFIQFLNTLRHPIQIYTQTRTINLENSIQTYRDKVKELDDKLERQKMQYQNMVDSGKYSKQQLEQAYYELTKQTNLCEYGKDIIYTTERMSLNKNVLNKKYYIVIPYYTSELGQNDFDKDEKKNLAFSELYTRAQSIIRTLSVCGINAGILDSNGLVDLLYVAYNRDDAEVYGLDKALKAGYDELYSTAPDVLDKKMRALDAKITQEAFIKANNAVVEAKSKKQKALERKENRMDDLIEQMAQLIIDENRAAIGNKVADEAQDVIKEERARRKGRPRKEEGGTKENEQKEQTSKK
ncbi:uncharacterized protein BN581_00347 [Clostridium sp. CAG:273]|nr:uncharacterized protein BN581_00347 [Clostridium sp. CAG:273]